MSDSEDNNVVDLNTRILTSIRDEIVRTRTELRGELVDVRDEIGRTRTELRDEIATTRNELGARISTLEAETIRGFTGVRQELDRINQRLDNVVDLTGASHRDHEVRITRIETTIAGMRRRRPRT